MPKKALSNRSGSARKPPYRARCPTTPSGRSRPEALQRLSGTAETTSAAVLTMLSSWAVADTPPASVLTAGPHPTAVASTTLLSALVPRPAETDALPVTV
eukprot:scaffold123610_cov25-Tisochrysis_lutea.AAC.4